MPRHITVVSAGLRQPSSTRLLADRLAEAARRELEGLGAEVSTRFVDVRDHGHDLHNFQVMGLASAELRSVLDAVSASDGLIAVTPVYAASYSGLFKMFVDALDEGALADKPVLMAATGGTGRHSLVLEHAMRPLFSYLRAAPTPTAVFAAAEDWGAGTAETLLGRRVDRAAAEFARDVHRRDTPVVTDPYAVTTPFEQLLSGD